MGKFSKFVASIISLLALFSCASTEPVTPQLKTIVPDSFEKKSHELGKNAVLGKETVKVLRISRNRAELRKGPGTNYEIQDEILKNGETCLLLEEMGVWRKILPLTDEGTKKTGWVHKKTISVDNSVDKISINLNKLPAVVAIKRVNKIFSYSKMEQIKVDIPKGTAFVALQKHKWRTLVWLPQTNSLAWVSQRDFR